MRTMMRQLFAVALLMWPDAWTIAADAPRFPSKTIHFIVPVPPGGGVDLLSRVVGAKMGQDMGPAPARQGRGDGHVDVRQAFDGGQQPLGCTV